MYTQVNIQSYKSVEFSYNKYVNNTIAFVMKHRNFTIYKES